MLKKPILTLSTDRSKISNIGKSQKMINSLLSDRTLSQIGLCSIDFDFFVNWGNNTITDEIWIKRIADETTSFNNFSTKKLALEIKSVDSNLYLKSLIDFSNSRKIKLKYKIFHEKDLNKWDQDRKNKSQEILEIEINKNGLNNIKYQTVDELMVQIQMLSGGPLNIGSKGLTYSTSTLEYYLSTSTAPWPGDADSVIMDAHMKKPLVLVELKKHTLSNEKIEAHTYERYVNGKDFRKYYRLALLAHYLQIPLIILYYSTKHQDYILVDKIEVILQENKWKLNLITRDQVKYPLNNLDYRNLIHFLIN